MKLSLPLFIGVPALVFGLAFGVHIANGADAQTVSYRCIDSDTTMSTSIRNRMTQTSAGLSDVIYEDYCQTTYWLVETSCYSNGHDKPMNAGGRGIACSYGCRLGVCLTKDAVPKTPAAWRELRKANRSYVAQHFESLGAGDWVPKPLDPKDVTPQ